MSPHDEFQQDGYWVAPVWFDAADVAELQAHFDAVLAGQYDLGRAPQGVNQFGAAMTKVCNAWWSDSVIRRAVHHPAIAMMAGALLDVEELYLWADSLYWKAPSTPLEQAAIGWHQDKQYWKDIPTDQMITAVIALYDANALNGGLRFVPGSHRWGLVGGEALTGAENAVEHKRPRIPEGQHWLEVCPTLHAGQVTFHHALTFHGSGPNASPAPRRSITIHMVSAEGGFREPDYPQLYPRDDRVMRW